MYSVPKICKPTFSSASHFLSLFILLYLGFVYATELSQKEIKEKLEEDCVIPDAFKGTPKHVIKVSFENGTLPVDFGTELTPRQTRDEPWVEWPTEPNTIYTLLSICTDVPERDDPILRDWVHWLVPNIKGCNVSTGDNINHWQGPGPRKDFGKSRYTFIVYKQNPSYGIHLNRTNETVAMRTWTRRIQFNTDEFVKHFHLGDPWAANYFVSEFNNFQ